MGAPGHPPPSGGGAVGAKKDNCRGGKNGKINSRSFCKNVFQSDRTLSRVCAMIKVSATRQGKKPLLYLLLRALKSGSGAGFQPGFDRIRNVGGVFRFGRWQLAKANCVYVPCFIKWSLLYGGTF